MTKQKSVVRVAMYILSHSGVSRQELALALGLSMPTVFQNVNELIERGLICEEGTCHSTGGRRAKLLTARQGICCAIGAEITAQHVRLLLLDLDRKVMDSEQASLAYEDREGYYAALGGLVRRYAEKNGVGIDLPYRLVGVGLAIPGIIDQRRKMLDKSHALNAEHVSLRQFGQSIPYPVVFDNDANLAAYAEVIDKRRNTVYLSLNDTVGGAIYQHGDIYQGDHFRSGEFGHMILVPGGKKCYCGKRGCVDAYCSARLLRRDEEDQALDRFFEAVNAGDKDCVRRWNAYLEHLAIAVANLRTAFDCDITVGGSVGGYIDGYMQAFAEKVRRYNSFDTDAAYLSSGQFRREGAAIGAARRMLDTYIEQLGD